MLGKLKAWKELMKLGLNVSKLRDDIDTFFRGNVIGVLNREGWFDYLNEPRTLMQFAADFQYTDTDLLEHLLDLLVEDGTIVKNLKSQYYRNGPVDLEWTCPSCFDGAMKELWVDHAKAIPDRLRNEYLSFTGGLNLFNWDDALSNKLYEQIRKSAFVFANALKKPARFLDIGCGNGRGTAAIWHYYYSEGHFGNGSGMEVVGIDPSERLLTIAREEFVDMVNGYSRGEVVPQDVLRNNIPAFRRGYAEDIPFEDDYFDLVYASQVLHWTDPREAIKEMIRVVRPGGLVFGTQNFHPDANKFNEVHFKVVRGAHGFFFKNEMKKWAHEMGARDVEFATPISVFKIKK